MYATDLFGMIEELTGQHFMSAGITQSAVLQRAKLKTVLDKIDKLLQMHPEDSDRKWSVECMLKYYVNLDFSNWYIVPFS